MSSPCFFFHTDLLFRATVFLICPIVQGSAAALWDEEGIVELIQEVPPAPAAKALAAPMLALTCMERKEESLRLLNTFTAAKQLAAASARFKVEASNKNVTHCSSL